MNTETLFDKLIIFLCCLILYFCQTVFDINVAIITVVISFVGFISFFDNPVIKVVLTVGYSVLCMFVPSSIIFMPAMTYDMAIGKYRAWNVVALIPIVNFVYEASLLLTITVTGLVTLSLLIRYRTENQIKMHKQNNRLSDTAREMSSLLEQQKTDLIQQQDNELHIATLNERNRIAREIHDNVGHLLSSSILQSAALKTIAKEETVKTGLDTLSQTLTKAMNNVRESVHGIYDQSIDLNLQIQEIIDQFGFCEIKYDYFITGNPNKKIKYAFITIVKEALANVAKHSDATLVTVTLREHPALYQLIIKDNGHVKSYRTDEGLGLRNMADRVESLKGHMNISIKNGFEIFISVPKE